ncbi:unnamed protein product [Cyprideis torosa]|uniref:Uncharacterized protein n=1 Tax=Cyprideis torosa TaxID=163714 RepID=A0A7R8WM91_9CRUS|nr:unnamed protein product [Cyprideis torosa]CAG0903414.1 unnamed protein product [Cyprideis torosa]
MALLSLSGIMATIDQKIQTEWVVGPVLNALVCAICEMILHDPVQTPCEHVFCRECMEDFIQKSKDPTCPIDREPMAKQEWQRPALYLRQMLQEMKVRCPEPKCEKVVQVDAFQGHRKACRLGKIRCEKGCGTELARKDFPNHDCIKELRDTVEDLRQQLSQQRVADEVKCQWELVEGMKLSRDEMAKTQARMNEGLRQLRSPQGTNVALVTSQNKYAMLDASSSLGASSEQMGRRGHGGGGSNYKSSSQNLPPRLQKQQKGGLASDRERSSSRGGSGRRSVPPTAAPVLPMAKDGAPPSPWARSTRSQDAPPARTVGSPLLRTAGDATLPRAGRKNLSQSPARQNAAALERRAVNGTEKLDAQKLDEGKVKEVAKKLVAIVSQYSDCIESVIGVYEPNSVGPLLLEVLDQSVDVLSPKTWADNVALTNCNRLLNYIKQEAEMDPDEDDDEERESSVPSDTTAAPVLPMAKDEAPPAPWARSTRSQDAPPARTEGSPLLRTAGDATLPRAGRKNLSQSPARQNAAALERRAVNGTEKLDAQKLDEGKVKEVAKKLVAIVSQYSDCIESVIGVYEPNSVGPLLLEVLDQSVDVLSPKTWPLLREILGDIATRPDLASVGALTSCLQMFAANLGNLALDFPQIFDYFGEVTSSLVVKQPSPFAFLCEVLKSLKSPDKIDEYDVPEERWQYAGKTFAACVKKMSDRIGKDSLAASWRKGGKDLEEFLSPEQSLSSLGIEFLVPPRTIILSLLESNCTVAKNGQKELDFQPIVQWSENDSPVRAGSEEFIQALIQAVCDFCITEGTGDACKFVEKNLEACILLLKRFADEKSSVCDPELEYIFAFQDALKWREFPKSLQMHQLLTFLIDHDIISAESITDWSKNTKADNVALTNCNRLLNYIKQEAEMDPDEDDDEERESSVPSDTTAAPSQSPATSSVAKEGESSSHS